MDVGLTRTNIQIKLADQHVNLPLANSSLLGIGAKIHVWNMLGPTLLLGSNHRSVPQPTVAAFRASIPGASPRSPLRVKTWSLQENIWWVDLLKNLTNLFICRGQPGWKWGCH